ALSKKLMSKGYEVQIVTHRDFLPLANEHGVNIAPIQLSSKECTAPLINAPEMNPFTTIRLMRGILEPLLESILPDMWKAASDSDVIISSGTTLWGLDIAEKLEVPHILAALQPIFPTAEFPHPSLLDLPRLGFLNQLSYIIVGYSYWQMIARTINEWRVEYLKLPKKIDRFIEPKVWNKQLHLLAYSPLVVPQPPDWVGNVATTGYWRLPCSTYSPNNQLIHFLESSPTKPIYIGFGSMLYKDMKHVASIVISALRQSGHRGVISLDEIYLRDVHLPENIINVNSVPHDWLFPQLAAAIHHGGAGTTAAAMRAGIPSIAIPSFADQAFWGQRIEALGVGPSPVPKGELTVERLIKAIQTLTSNQQMKRRAIELKHQLVKENGVDKAVDLIHKHICHSEDQ
ncbi:MAG: glycosyltransferase, partial [Phormidesmis sp.]